jgi:hypothetical protein
MYVAHRMLPPGLCRYFFTADGVPQPLVAADQMLSHDSTDLTIRNMAWKKDLVLNCLTVKPLPTFIPVSLTCRNAPLALSSC